MTPKGLLNIIKVLTKRVVAYNLGKQNEDGVIQGIILALECVGFKVEVKTKLGVYREISIIDIDGEPIVILLYTSDCVITYDYTNNRVISCSYNKQ